MQLIVLGMHRSGTSTVTRLINLMGGYFGPEGIAVRGNIENPKGFWERRDVLDLDSDLLASAQADWFRIGQFRLDTIPATALNHFHDKASKIVHDLDAHRPWVIKEPRMCLLFPLWRELLEAPICIYVHRQPIQVAQSLQTRNGFPLAFGLALWERYTLDALRGAAELPVILVKHEEIIRNPVAATQKLLEKLQSFGVSGLHLPSDKEIVAFIDPALHRNTGGIDFENGLINVHQKALAEALTTDIQSLLAKADELQISAGGLANLLAYEQQLEFQQTLAELRASYDASIRDLATLRASYDASTRDLATLRASKETLANSAKLLKDRILHLNNRISQYQANTIKIKEKMGEYRTNALALEQRLNQYRSTGERLERDFESLRSSARWQLGNRLVRMTEILMLRGKPRLVIDDMAATFAAIKRWEPVKIHPPQSGTPAGNREVARLGNWLARLDRDFGVVMQSRRWRVGGILAIPLAIARGRGRAGLATDALRATFQRYHTWVPSGDMPRDLHQLDTWLLQIEQDLDNLLASRRWLLGHAFIGTLEHLLGRGRPRLVVEDMREILNLARRWREGLAQPGRHLIKGPLEGISMPCGTSSPLVGVDGPKVGPWHDNLAIQADNSKPE